MKILFNRLKISLLGLVTFVMISTVWADGPFVNLSLQDALRKARQERKLVFVDFYTTWCGPCKVMDQTTFRDPRLIGLLKSKAICIKVDAEKQSKFAKDFLVKAYPTFSMLGGDGKEIQRWIGYRDAVRFYAEIQGVGNKRPPQTASVPTMRVKPPRK